MKKLMCARESLQGCAEFCRKSCRRREVLKNDNKSRNENERGENRRWGERQVPPDLRINWMGENGWGSWKVDVLGVVVVEELVVEELVDDEGCC